MKTKKVMKTMKKNILSLAALLIASATIAACSGDDDSILNDQTADTHDGQTGQYTMTIQATKGGTDDAQTRGLALSGKTLNVKWNEGETVEVMMADNAISGTYTTIGTLTAAASETGQTTLTGTVSGLTTGKALRFFLRGHEMDYTGQKGVLLNSDDAVNSIEAKYDYAATDAVTSYTVSGTTVTVAGGITLTSQQAVVKFTLKDLSGNAINATSLTIKENTGANGHICLWRDANKISGNTLGSLTVTPAAATSTVYAAIYDFHNATSATSSYTLEATDADGNTYAYTKDGILFASGQYYEVSVKMREFVNLGLSVKWATTNVGAASQTDRGNYFAWGETTGYAYGSGHDFSAANYSLYDSGTTTLTKYTLVGSAFDYTTLQTADDAAAQSWGGTCRMPTKAEWQELIDNCTAEWQTEGTPGVKFTSTKSGYTTKSIFLPGTGFYTGTSNSSTDIYACYWSSSLYTVNKGSEIEPLYAPIKAWYLDVLYNNGSIYRNQVTNENRYYGMAVRPVLP